MSKLAARTWLVGLSLALGAGRVTLAAETAPAAPAAGSPYTSAQVCATCHRTIHGYWSESAHARAATAPAYAAGLAAAVAAASDKEAARRDCVWCHAPTALATGDYALEQDVTREGVSCDFCHTVAAVKPGAQGSPFEIAPGKVKRGPLQYARSPFHDTEYSPLHKGSALLCAACHEHTNALGVPVLSTYSEWKESPYPERGMVCQECHMPLVPGSSVREGLTASERRINLHRLVGGSAASKVGQAISLRIASLDLGGDSASLEVVVTNSGAGHAVPGGLSSKRLVLAVGAEPASGGLAQRLERVYRRQMKDAAGQDVTSAGELFTRAAAVGEDTRLRPLESRSERFTLPLPKGARAIVVRLEYQDASDPAAPRTTLVAEERRPLAGR